jgi:hypothetical protein
MSDADTSANGRRIPWWYPRHNAQEADEEADDVPEELEAEVAAALRAECQL